jgi:hypothetical protein
MPFGQEPNVGSLAGIVGSSLRVLAPKVSRKCPLFASPSLTVCKPLHLGKGISEWIKKFPFQFYAGSSPSKCLLYSGSLSNCLGRMIAGSGSNRGPRSSSRRWRGAMSCGRRRAARPCRSGGSNRPSPGPTRPCGSGRPAVHVTSTRIAPSTTCTG